MAATRRLLQRVSTAFSTVGALRSYGVIDGVGIRIRAHNYHPVPVVFSRATGTIWDSEGKRYINFLAAYSAVNQGQGHCHPKIIKALQEQVEKLTLSSRAFYNDQFPVFAERLRNMLVISMSCDNDATRGFGPLLPGNLKVDFGDADSLENIFKARSGKMLACDWEEVRPDMVILGKALGGGVIPVSAVLADKDVMLHIKPGQHGSTFGGNPLASDVAMASLDVIEKEKLVERSASHGEELRIQLNEIKKQYLKYIKEVRGRGLFNAFEFNSESLSPVSANGTLICYGPKA
uniref:Ornithine aminotransferase n=1 Tax=Brassica campestris TaxID=3711 RepID=M4DM39_BRACM